MKIKDILVRIVNAQKQLLEEYVVKLVEQMDLFKNVVAIVVNVIDVMEQVQKKEDHQIQVI